MEKGITKFVAAISTLVILAAFWGTGAIEVKKGSTGVSAKNTRSLVDHDGLARRYENRAEKLLEIAAEHEKWLQYYEDESYLYGRHGQDSQAHSIAMVQKYKRAAEKATESAFHHRMVSQLAKRDYIALRTSH
ncbi:MAG: hypothetical protein ABI284_04765 [Nitrosospira sp.]